MSPITPCTSPNAVDTESPVPESAALKVMEPITVMVSPSPGLSLDTARIYS